MIEQVIFTEFTSRFRMGSVSCYKGSNIPTSYGVEERAKGETVG